MAKRILLLFLTMSFFISMASISLATEIEASDSSVSVKSSGVRFQPSKLSLMLDNKVREINDNNDKKRQERKVNRPPKPQSFKDLRWF